MFFWLPSLETYTWPFQPLEAIARSETLRLTRESDKARAKTNYRLIKETKYLYFSFYFYESILIQLQ